VHFEGGMSKTRFSFDDVPSFGASSALPSNPPPDSRIWLFPTASTLHDCDVSVDGESGESFDFAAGQWPFYFEPIDF